MSENKDNQASNGMEELKREDDALFEALGQSRKKKKHRILRTVLIIVLIVAVILVAGVSILRRNVRERFAAASTEVLSAAAEKGTISTVVSGSGILTNVDTETVSIPSGVEVTEILVEFGDVVSEGSLLATVDMSTVRTAMSDLQTQIEDLDDQINDAEGDTVSSYVSAGVPGRVKILYGEAGDQVQDVMVEHGALAVISLDGHMAVDVQTDALKEGDTVTVRRSEGEPLTGTVEDVVGSTATILVTDNATRNAEEVTILTEEGTEIGTGALYIHSPLAVTGYAGTISQVSVGDNTQVYASSPVYILKNTGTTASYDALLRTRSEAEETLLELLSIQRYGGLTAPISGSVYSVADLEVDETATDIVVLSPDVSVSVTISVDESDILSLELEQQADVTVSSVSEDVLTGIVTEIDKTASDGAYTAQVTLDKIEGMLPGMTADVDIRIEGVEDAILIPVDALHRTSNSYYVYTSFDTETEEYGGRVDVTIGLSNDDYVEIKSGLREGDTVYYTKVQSFMDMFANMGAGRFGNTGSGSGGSSGRMPGGSMPAMPSGGMPGGRG